MKKRKKSDGAGVEARCRRIVRDLAYSTAQLCLFLKYKYSQRHSERDFLCLQEVASPLL